MKKIFKTLVVILLILLIIIASLVVWQWKNIKPLLISINNSAETIDIMVVENEGQINKVLNELTEGNVRALSEDEREKLLRGELSEEEAIKFIINTPDEQYKSENNVDDIISRMYLLRAEYVNKLTSLEAEARSKAKAVLKQKTSTSEKLALIESYTGKAVALEKECDGKMISLIEQLKIELERLGKNTEVISEVREVYEAEKALKKSQLLSKYNKYLK